MNDPEYVICEILCIDTYKNKNASHDSDDEPSYQ